MKMVDYHHHHEGHRTFVAHQSLHLLWLVLLEVVETVVLYF